MYSGVRVCLVAVFLSLLCGCGRAEPDTPSMMHQVLSALQIPEKAARDTALVAACRECASAGGVESVLLGLPKISDTRQRDEATNVIDE